MLSPGSEILLSACVYMCGSTSFKPCMQWPGRLIGGSGLLRGFCLVYLRFLFVYLDFSLYPRGNSWGKDFGVGLQASYASLFELFVMFELICPMFKKCGLLKNVDVHEKH